MKITAHAPAFNLTNWTPLIAAFGVMALVVVAAWWITMARPMKQGKDAVRELLRDPNGAQFRNVRLSSDGHVCGEVNPRNGMGGYTGFRPFFAMNPGDPARRLAYFEAVDGEEASLRAVHMSPLRAATCG